jgi:histidinol phosphatase-like PHP family hydrolase
VVDHHLHTRWSDGSTQPADLVAAAEKAGIRIGVSDHAGPGAKHIQAHNVDAYIAELRKYPVYRGVEIDVAYGMTFSQQQAEGLDYMIGSLHGVMRDRQFKPLDGMFRWQQTGGRFPYQPDVDLTDPEVWIQEWLDILDHCFRTTPIDILGHPTLTPVLPLASTGEEAYKPEWEERLCRLLIEHNVAMEISGRYKLPHERLIRTAKDMGVLFATGSDGHHPNQILDLAYPLLMIDQIGIAQEQLFDVTRAPRRLKRAA